VGLWGAYVCCTGVVVIKHSGKTAAPPRAAMKPAILVFAALLPLASSHSSLLTPKPRNAIDSELAEWAGGNAPYMWVPNIGKDGAPCACRNGSQPCESAQTCLWMSVGCSIGASLHSTPFPHSCPGVR
jgi:hypothetical protein